jgi:hypothetical protein
MGHGAFEAPVSFAEDDPCPVFASAAADSVVRVGKYDAGFAQKVRMLQR